MLELKSGTDFGGRYQVVRCIGSGGMGAVYLATDPRYRDFEVALKVLYPGIIKTPESRERFRTEIIASYKIPHRNIVRAYEYFDEENVQAYAMEYVNGGDLQVLMRRGDISLETSVSILRQSAAGLYAIHRQGIMHRDLKPENILLTAHDIVKIGDFGVARLRESNSSVTQIGAMVGTPKYFSPEYIETGETDHRGDIYALGVIGYELIAGISPFRSDSRIGMMVERIKRPQVPLSKVAPHCPSEVAKIIEKAMALSVMDRYQSAEEMREDLALVQEGKPPRYARDFVDTAPVDAEQDVVKVNVALNVSDPVVAPIPKRTAIQPRRSMRSGKRPDLVFAALAFIALVVCVGYYLVFGMAEAVTLEPLLPGVYEGVVQNIDDSGTLYKMTMWKAASGQVAVHVNRTDCEATRLDADFRFPCDKSQYELDIESANNVSALGSIRLIEEGRWGSWSVTRQFKNQSE